MRIYGSALVLALAACTAAPPTGHAGDDLTSVGGVARRIDWDSFVYVGASADDAAVQTAIRRQVKSALGALREQTVGIADRDAQSNLDPSTWVREPVEVVDAGGAVADHLVRVRYHYGDSALVGTGSPLLTAGRLDTTLLFGDYTQGAAAAALQPACVDEQTDPDSLWYHYAPSQAGCRAMIALEQRTIDGDFAPLAGGAGRIPASDAHRRFVPLRATLTPVAAAPTRWPEYDRLWGFGSDRQKVVLYAFVGVEHDARDSHDASAAEYQRLLRTLRQQLPGLHVVDTQPFAMLLDFDVDGKRLANVTWDDVARWMIDDTGYPAEVAGDAARTEALRQQVLDRFLDRTIVWQLPVTVSRGGETRAMTVEIRTYWGMEDGDADTRQRAIWRYLDAFWNADVFAYAGHSHFGHGPLEPTLYGSGNFPDRYQVMLVNSCLSYNYYDLDFIRMHPGQERNLEVVMNGLPAWWNGMGESTGRYLAGLVDGSGKSYAQLLDAMRIADPWGRPGYEPMRGVNGELDNVYDANATPLVVKAAP